MLTGFPLRGESLTILVLLLGISATNLSRAQSNGNEAERTPRTLEILDVGYQLPIEILAVRNLQKNTHWIRDLELEIKNSSPKPIYGFYADLFMPDDKGPGGYPVAVSLKYGRSDLIHPTQHASGDDKPIGPGQTVKLKVDEPWWLGYEYHLANEDVPQQATYRVRLTIVAINFGDGTGFINGGVPYPRDPRMESRPQRFVRIAIRPE